MDLFVLGMIFLSISMLISAIASFIQIRRDTDFVVLLLFCVASILTLISCIMIMLNFPSMPLIAVILPS